LTGIGPLRLHQSPQRPPGAARVVALDLAPAGSGDPRAPHRAADLAARPEWADEDVLGELLARRELSADQTDPDRSRLAVVAGAMDQGRTLAEPHVDEKTRIVPAAQVEQPADRVLTGGAHQRIGKTIDRSGALVRSRQFA